MTETHEITGYRFISRDFSPEPKVGDALDRSFIWDGDDFLGEILIDNAEVLEVSPW